MMNQAATKTEGNAKSSRFLRDLGSEYISSQAINYETLLQADIAGLLWHTRGLPQNYRRIQLLLSDMATFSDAPILWFK